MAHATPLLDDDLLLAQLFAPAAQLEDGPSPFAKLQVSAAMSASASAASSELDEARLLDETDALLEILVPAAFDEPLRVDFEALAPPSRAAYSTDSGTSAGDSDSSARTALPPKRAHNPNRKRNSKPGSMRNPSRERLQDELEYLRKQVLALETVLQSEHDKKKSAAAGALVQSAPAAPALKWERIAKRQLAGSERAMSENKRLRSMLALQRELVVGMEEKLYAWQHGAPAPQLAAGVDVDATASALAALVPQKTVRLEPGDDLLFAMLVSELDGAYARVPELFRAAGLDRLSDASFARTTVKTEPTPSGALRSFFELVEVDVAPFEFEMMTRVMRLSSERLSETTDTVAFDGGWDAERVFAEKCRLTRALNGVAVGLDMLTAMKEFAFEDRVVVVWRSIFKSDAHFPGAYVHESGARVTAARAADPAAPARSSTVERSCVHFEPKRFASPATVVRADGDLLTDLVVSSYRDEMSEMDELMDNLLIAETKRQP